MQVREQASKTIREVFPLLPDEKKDEGWEEMLELAGGESADHAARMKILPFLPSVFSSVPDKNKAWETIFRFTGDERETVRKQVVDALVSISTEISDKAGGAGLTSLSSQEHRMSMSGIGLWMPFPVCTSALKIKTLPGKNS